MQWIDQEEADRCDGNSSSKSLSNRLAIYEPAVVVNAINIPYEGVDSRYVRSG
jgi:hypothetical protein